MHTIKIIDSFKRSAIGKPNIYLFIYLFIYFFASRKIDEFEVCIEVNLWLDFE